jgi:hypothetical protein
VSAPPGDDIRFRLACLHLLQNDVLGYRQLCLELLERIGQSEEGFTRPAHAYVASRTCTLSPESTLDPAQGVLWAEKVVAIQRNVPWHLHTLVLAQYRAGQFEQAVKRSNESLKTSSWWGGALNWLVLAMAHKHLGQLEEARSFMDKVVAWRQKSTQGSAPKGEPATPPEMHLNEWLEFHVLYPEAQALLKTAGYP